MKRLGNRYAVNTFVIKRGFVTRSVYYLNIIIAFKILLRHRTHFIVGFNAINKGVFVEKHFRKLARARTYVGNNRMFGKRRENIVNSVVGIPRAALGIDTRKSVKTACIIF